MASPVMVCKTITNVCENTSAAPEGSRTFIRSEQRNSLTSRKKKLATPVMDSFPKKLSSEGSSEEYPALIANAR